MKSFMLAVLLIAVYDFKHIEETYVQVNTKAHICKPLGINTEKIVLNLKL